MQVAARPVLAWIVHEGFSCGPGVEAVAFRACPECADTEYTWGTDVLPCFASALLTAKSSLFRDEFAEARRSTRIRFAPSLVFLCVFCVLCVENRVESRTPEVKAGSRYLVAAPPRCAPLRPLR